MIEKLRQISNIWPIVRALEGMMDERQREDGMWVDPDDCCHETKEDYIHSGLMGFCGCGCPEESLSFVRDVLKHIKRLQDEVHPKQTAHTKQSITWDQWHEDGKKIGSEGALYFAYYWLDTKGYTEHGGAVPGWLTEKGKAILKDLEELEL